MISVGIDIGTSTTSMVVSRLCVENTSSCFNVPRVAITDKEIIYRSQIYQTPLKDEERIDTDAILKIIQGEYVSAKISPEMVETGAVIITGESSRKENAESVTSVTSNLAGEFVVAAAGPDLESIIAAKGSGAWDYSVKNSCTVANLDIGGGTTNIAVFNCGELVAKGCFDIGGRLVKINNGHISYISPRLQLVIDALGIDELGTGRVPDDKALRTAADKMAEVLGEILGFSPISDLGLSLETKGSTHFSEDVSGARLFFSGGVADYIYHPSTDWYKHGDIGPLLADSIRNSSWYKNAKVEESTETIRATVIGAGSYTTTVSGSTIIYSDDSVFPMKNVPAFVTSEDNENQVKEGNGKAFIEQAAWFLKESSADNILFCLNKINNPSYKELCNIADVLTEASNILGKETPLLILTRNDFAKSLGQALIRRLGDSRKIVSIDSVHTVSGDYVDLGRPLFDGLAIPVVVKTLIYG